MSADGFSLWSSVEPVTLAPWQDDAVDAWVRGHEGAAPGGTLEVFTGGGKTLLALECIRRAADEVPDLKVAVVVPTTALARQWRQVLLDRTALRADDIGALDGQRKDTFAARSVIVAVLNTAAERLPELSSDISDRLMLVVDECHRAGAPAFSKVLDTGARFRLGLSATAERDDLDENGMPVPYDEQVLGRKLGPVVYRFDLRAAREVGWLPEYKVVHHAVELTHDERRRYEELSRRVDDLADQLRSAGSDASQARVVAARGGDVAVLARSYIAVTAQRKDLLYRARERQRVVSCFLSEATNDGVVPRALLFHERVDEAEALHARLSSELAPMAVGLEHSRLPAEARRSVLAGFANGTVPVLVSVKSLVEGIDVPDADLGVSVASSASVRQRVQALGRVLRRRFDGVAKSAVMHVVYVHDSVDEAIYGKEDWSDLTGQAANHYLLWRSGSEQPEPLPGPPRTPRPTEEQFWEALGGCVPDRPVTWEPDLPQSEWRVDSRGSVTDLAGGLVANEQGVAAMVMRVKPGGGRFRVSPRRLFVVVPDMSGPSPTSWLVGRLAEPFRVIDPGEGASAGSGHQQVEAAKTPGAVFTGSQDHAGGTYQLRQKAGGVIERRSGSTREWAATELGSGPDELVDNAVRLLAAWRTTGEGGLRFTVNSDGDAFYVSAGSARYLASVPGGFSWPG